MNRKTEDWVFGVLTAALGIYILLRAWLLPITVDESSTIINHVPRLVVDILTYESDAVPNNHILNTIAIKAFAGLFGWHPFVMRLPVLLGAFLYCGAAMMLSRRLSQESWVRLFAFVVLLGSPFMLEFFSLARGYGLAVGLMLAAIWQAWVYLEKNTRHHLRNAVIFAGFAVYANFTQLLVFAPFMLLLFLAAWQSNPSTSRFLKKAKPALIALGIFVALWITPLIRMSMHSDVQGWNVLPYFFASLAQLVKATIRNSAYLGDYTVEILTWSAVLFSLGIWGVAVWRWWKKGRRFADDPRLFLLAVVLGTAITNIAQVNLTRVPYLEPRLSLLYYPLFALQLGVAAAWLWERWQHWTWAYMAPVLLLLFINLSRCLNLRESSEWWVDKGTYEVLDYLERKYVCDGRSTPYTLDAHWILLNSYIFHLERDPRGFGRYAKLVPYHGNREPQRDADFYYAINLDEVKNIMDAYEVVLEIPGSSLVLLRKK